MKLPFVSRDLYESVLARLESEREVSAGLRHDLVNTVERWAELVKAGDAKYAELLSRYHMLRMQGAVEVAPIVPPKPLDGVARAIADVAGANPELRAMMEAQAAQDRIEGKNDADIEMAIRLGVPFDEGTFI